MAAGHQILFKLFTVFLLFSIASSNKNIINLNEDNWTQMLENEWMVEFYAPWCPACKGLQPTWKEFATWSKDLGINVGQVDVTKSPGLSGRFIVTALPTIFHVINGEFRQYKGTRDKDAFFSFVEEKKWEKIDPIPSWKSPNSFQMSIVSSFFKLSQVLRGIHNQLMEDFGLPTWGSYLIFALATIFLGAVLGLVLVCLIDMIYPPRSTKSLVAKTDKKDEKNSGDELDDEYIKDDLLDDADVQKDAQTEKTKSNPSSPNVRKRKSRKE